MKLRFLEFARSGVLSVLIDVRMLTVAQYIHLVSSMTAISWEIGWFCQYKFASKVLHNKGTTLNWLQSVRCLQKY